MEKDAALARRFQPVFISEPITTDAAVLARITSYNVCYTKLLRRALSTCEQTPEKILSLRGFLQSVVAENFDQHYLDGHPDLAVRGGRTS